MKKFTRKSWRAKLALAVTAGILAAGYMPQAFAATYSGAMDVIWGMESDDSKTFGSKVAKNADGALVYDFGEDVTFVKSNIGQPKSAVNNGTVPGSVIIKDNFKVIMHSTDWSAIAVKAGWMEGNFDEVADKRGTVTFDGNVTMRDKSVEGEWGVTASNIHGGYSSYKGARWQPVGIRAGLSGDVIINGNLDLAVKGSALVTDPYYKALKTTGSTEYADDYKLATITTNGDVNIDTPEDMTEAFYSIANYGGTVNINTDGTIAKDNKVVINGNILTMRDGNGGDYFYRSGQTNVALTNEQSSWTGVVDNTGADQAGEVNLWVQNNATWNHKALSLTNGISLGEVPQQSAPHYGKYDGVSHINKLNGGSSAGNAGLIFQDDAAAIDINNYSGYTTVFYKHNNDGSSSADYTAGDVIIRNAEKDSAINMVTDSSKIDTKDSAKLNSVLNALAGKLTYSDYVNNPENLLGTVKIVGGLTNDSVTIKSGKIQFADNGKGSYTKPAVTNFASTLTGDADKDTEYAEAAVIQGDGSYKFTEDTSINVSGEGAKGMNFAKDTAVDASGKTLTVNVTDASKGNAGIAQDVDANSTVKADKLVIKLDSTKSGQGAQGIRQTKGSLTVDGNVDMDIKGDDSTAGIYSYAGSTTVNGDVKVALDGNRGGFNEYGAAGIYAHAGYGGAVGGTINVNGNVDISGVGNGLFANIGGATINVNGGKINIVDTDKKNGYSAIYAANGKINVNTVKDADGKVTGAGNNKVDITGNIVTSVGAVNYVDCCTETEVNVGLTTKDSKLTGVIYNEFPEAGKVVSQRGDSKTFTGAANLWLQNGATWTNEQQGELPSVWGGEKFNGSRVAKFVGGTSAETAGNIYQKDSKALTINDYSGVTNIFYEHTGDGTTYNAGDTIIKHAEKNSQVNLITSSKGLTINADTINNTLNALAGKLTYSNYAEGERNLDGKVKIAGGLTSNNVTMAVGNILFSEADGKGNGVNNLKVSAPDHQVSTSFNSTVTGDTEKDLEYVLGGVVKDGSYKFTEDSSINVTGSGVKGMELAKATTIDAIGKTLNVNVTNASNTNAGIYQDKDVDSSIKADKLVIKLESTKSGNGAHAIHQNQGNLMIDGNVDIDVTGDYSTVGVYSHAGSTTINGDLKVKLDGNHGGFGEYGAAGIYAHAGYGGATGGTITVNGNVDISGVGNGLFANIGGAEINVKGGKINIVDDKSNGYSAIYATCGNINMNVLKDAEGKVTGADKNDVDITGNVVVSTGAVNYLDSCLNTNVNLGLTTKDSKLTGVIYNAFPEAGKVVSQRGDSKTFTGAANLWLQNGATWTNEQQGALPSPYMGEQFTGSRVAKFAGGTSAETAGNIYQKDSNALTINDYSGVTNIFYEHTGDGTTYNAGDTIIKHAEKDSQVNLITSSKGLTVNAETINNTLNALAGKLTYSNYAEGERNLDGKVKIAGGLTSDSVTMAVGNILFSEADGKGSGAEHITIPSAPESQVSKSFNSTLTGDTEKDLEYVLGGVVKDGNYKFTEDSSINVTGSGAKGMELAKATTVDASGKTLTINVTDASNTNAGIYQDKDVDSSIKAEKLVIKLESTKSGNGAHAIHQNQGNLTIDGNVDIDVTGDYSTVGVYSHAGSTTINGDLKVKLDGNHGGFGEYGAAGIYAHAGYGGATGGTITVNGNVDISGVGNGLFANIGGAEINVKGGKINIVDDKSNGYSAIYATCGNINMNVLKDAEGKVTGADKNDVDITGNVVVSTGAVNYLDSCLNTNVNLGLTTKDSKLTGVIYNAFPEAGKVLSQRGDSKTFTGAANLWLQNGATWTNEQQGILPSVWGGEQFTGSRVAKFVGGTSAETAGNIYQKDSNALTINDYSGVTNIYYEHDNNGSSASDYDKYGDTIIKHAAEGSVVNLVTNGTGETSGSAIADILSSLAGKLTYSGYVDGERNLKGSAIMAGGLTSNSVKWALKDIVFDEATGKGGVNKDTPVEFPDAPKDQEATDFNSGLTGDANLEYAYGGVVQEDGSYKFTESTNINVKDASAVSDTKAVNVDAAGKTLTLNSSAENGSLQTIAQANGNAINIKADNLVINSTAANGNTKAIAALQADKDNKAVTNIDANTFVKAEGSKGAMGAYIEGNAELNLNGDTIIEVKGNVSNSPDYGYYSASGLRANSNYKIQQGAVINANGNVNIKGDGVGVFANGGGSTINLNGGTNIEATSDYMAAVVAQSGVVNINMNGDADKASGNVVKIKGNLVAGAGSVNAAEPFKDSVINITLANKDSLLDGLAYNQFPADGIATQSTMRTWSAANSNNFTGEINLNISNGAQWINEEQGALPNPYTYGGGQAFTGSRITTLNGGADANHAGYIYQKDSRDLTIDNLSGSINVTYDHDINENQEIVYKGGNTVIGSAAAGSQVTMATASNGIDTDDKASVENAFNGLAKKLTYNDASANPNNLQANMQIGGGLTSNYASWNGVIEWDGTQGSYKLNSAEQTINILYDEDVVSKDTRAAIMSSMVGWRNAAADTYSYRSSARTQKVGGGRGPVVNGDAHGEDNEGVWARTWGGQNKYSGNNTSFKTSYWAGQVGYDKTFANGWNVGVAFDYQTGDDSYNAGSGDTKTYTLGFYGTKELKHNEYLDLTAKVGRISNDFETKDILGRTVKGDYKATGFSFSGQYSKRFGDEATGYFEPQAQLTIGRLGSSDFDSTGTLEGHISQDAFTSIVGRLGLEAGQASEHGRYFARLSLAHEFAGDMDTHFSDSSATMTREFNLDGTWCDMTVGGTYELNDRISFYGDVTKTLSGDYKQDWKVNAGLRFTF